MTTTAATGLAPAPRDVSSAACMTGADVLSELDVRADEGLSLAQVARLQTTW